MSGTTAALCSLMLVTLLNVCDPTGNRGAVPTGQVDVTVTAYPTGEGQKGLLQIADRTAEGVTYRYVPYDDANPETSAEAVDKREAARREASSRGPFVRSRITSSPYQTDIYTPPGGTLPAGVTADRIEAASRAEKVEEDRARQAKLEEEKRKREAERADFRSASWLNLRLTTSQDLMGGSTWRPQGSGSTGLNAGGLSSGERLP